MKTQSFLDAIFYQFDLDFEPFEDPCAASWTPLGPSWTPLGASWAPLGRLLGGSWRRKRTTDTPKWIPKGSPSDAQGYQGIPKRSPRGPQGFPKAKGSLGAPSGAQGIHKGSPRELAGEARYGAAECAKRLWISSFPPGPAPSSGLSAARLVRAQPVYSSFANRPKPVVHSPMLRGPLAAR